MKLINELMLIESKSVPSFPDPEKLRPFLKRDYHIEKLKAQKEQIEDAVKNGEVMNTTYKEYKERISRLIDDVFDTIGDEYYHAGAYKNLPEDYQELKYWGGAVMLKSLTKKMAKLKDKSLQIYKDLEVLVKLLMPYVEISDYLKDKVVMFKDKKAKEKVERVEKETTLHKQLVAHKDVKKVIDLLKDTATDIRKEFFERNLKWFISFVDRFNQRKEGTSYRDIKDPMTVSILSRIIETSGPFRDKQEIIKSDYKDILQREAQKMTDEIIDGFIYKNTKKIAYILTKKNNLKTVNISNVRFNAGMVECDITCMFKDTASFRVHNQVVLASSKYGNYFYRYPTTFHNVKMADGSKMAMPSELKMEKNFV